MDDGSTEARLIGREREIAAIENQFEMATGGRARVVLVAGEPGIGKTRLLSAVAGRASAAGSVVLRGGASEAEGMPPYLPFLEALGRYLRAAPLDALRDQVGDVAPILATLLPELATRLGELPSSYPLPPEQARVRLYEAVGAFLSAIATPRSLLLLLDDLQWADPSTLDLLCYVVRHQPNARLLALGAYREGEAAHPSFERTLAELNRLRALTTIRLEPLGAPEMATLSALYLGGSVDPALADLVGMQSEGNPFFAEELMRDWLEAGRLARHHGCWRLGSPGVPPLPATIAGAVRQRLQRLQPEAVEHLRTAAIIGRTFGVELLAAVLGQEPEPVEDRLREAVRARLIQGDGAERYTFSHDKIRECLYDEVTVVRRRRLHGFIGSALESAPEPDGPQRLAELAFHFVRSGDHARGAAYAVRAAEQARQAYAPSEALAQYRVALDLIAGTDARRGELLLGLGDVALLVGAEPEAVAAFEQAEAWYRGRGDRAAAARATHRLGSAWWRQEAIPTARTAFERTLALLEDDPGPDLIRVLVDLAGLLGVSLHEFDASIAHSRRALELANRLGDVRLIASSSRTLGNLLVRRNELPAGVELLERALGLAAAEGDLIEEAECCACLTVAYFWQGSLRRCDEVLNRRLTIAQQAHDPYQLRHVYVWLALGRAMRGDLEESEMLVDQAQAIVERLASPEPLAYLHLARGGLAYQRGRYDEAEGWFDRAMAAFRAIGPDALLWYLGFPALLAATRGNLVAARALMAELETLLERVPAGTMPTGEPLTYLTQVALLLDDRERLKRYYPRLIPFRGQFHDLLVDRLLGEIATLQRDWGAAEAYLTAAEVAARREDLIWELPRVLEAQAALVLAEGSRESGARARGLLEQGVELWERQGSAPEARRLRDRLCSLTSRTRRPALPAGLSVRETDVLRLVATGRSNREIADQLFISESTVAHHLTSIFTKTGVENRAGAAAFAIRHGLA